jgi:hypothetical protein
MRPQILPLVPLLLGPIAACGRGGDQALPKTLRAQESLAHAGAGVLGTIHATVDGVQRTWYVVDGEARGKPYASAMWFERAGVRVISVGGFDSDHPPIESFRFDVAAGDVSFGSYSGSTMQVLISIAAGERTARVEVPVPRGRQAAVAYMPVAGGDMLTGTFSMTGGTIAVTDVQFVGNAASVRGTFQGTLQTVDESARVEIVDGRFEASGIPRGPK